MEGGDQLPSIKLREQMIAHQVLTTTVSNFQEQNFIAFVSREKLFNIAHEMIKFLNDGDLFLNYKQPPSFMEDVDKEEAIKRLALMSTINEEPAYIPFKHR